MYNKIIVIELTLITLMVSSIFIIVMKDHIKEIIRNKKFKQDHENYKNQNKSKSK